MALKTFLLLLLTCSVANALEMPLNEEITDGTRISLFLYRDIENFQDPSCVRTALKDNDEKRAFLLAGCRIDRIFAKKDFASTLDGKSYVEVSFRQACPNSQRPWGTVSWVVSTCVLK